MPESSSSNNDPNPTPSAAEADGSASEGSVDNNGSPTGTRHAEAASEQRAGTESEGAAGKGVASNNGPEASGENASDDAASEDIPEPSAVDDLASGLGFMFRAAKKAVRSLDPQKIEALGREAADRASREVDKIDREKVNEFGRKAAKTLNPERIEKAAEDAGRELLSVVERVAGRVEQAFTPKTTTPAAPADKDADRDAAEPHDAP